MDISQVILVIILCVLLYLWGRMNRPKTLPPGPDGIPFLGYWPFLGRNSHLKLRELGQKYGNLFSMKMGNQYAIVLNDWNVMKQTIIKSADVFSGRPNTFIFTDVRGGTDIASCWGPLWKEKRQFTYQGLKEFGFGKVSMESLIKEEVVSLLDRMKVTANQKNQINDLFFLPFFNVMWTIAGGLRMKPEDEKLHELRTAVHEVLREAHNTSILQFTPYLKHFPTIKQRLQTFYKMHSLITRFIGEVIDEHENTYKEESQRDFIDVYLTEIYKKQKNGEHSISFQKSHLAGVLYNLNNGGIDTGNQTQNWAMLYMATWPRIQKKVQDEIDRVIGRDRLPSYDDRLMLPYTEAVLMEVQRYASILSLSFPHACTKNIKVGNYIIPRGSYVIQNLYAVHHDAAVWGDPEVFRPERFLNDKGQATWPEYLIPFSVGKRVCLGEAVAKMQMFLIFSCVLHQFSFSYVNGEKPPCIEPVEPVGLVLEPRPFSLFVKRR